MITDDWIGVELRQTATGTSPLRLNFAGKASDSLANALSTQISAFGDESHTFVCDLTQPWLIKSVFEPDMWTHISSTCSPQWVVAPDTGVPRHSYELGVGPGS